MKIKTLLPEYVKQLPARLEEGILYICEDFDLTAHKCCCGCGEDVYLKLGPAKWQLSAMPDGSITLYPSVGNWNYTCRSHYWIEENRVIEARPMDDYEIKRIQKYDRQDRERYIDHFNVNHENERSIWKNIYSITTKTLRALRGIWPW